MALKDLGVGKTARIVALAGDDHMNALLREIGFHEDAEVEKLGVGPLGSPFQIRLGRMVIALRPDEAEAIEVAALT
ncbi:MAG: FeoA family protein [Pseudomonadota bacterium]